MGQFVDRTGQTFFRLTVMHRGDNIGKRVGWVCRCECGQTTHVTATNLVTGVTKSCGCAADDARRRNSALGGIARTTHGLYKTREYNSWQSMRDRCLNPNSDNFPNYGGRGIQIDPRWDDFTVFLADMGPRPPNKSIERLDTSANYGPDNCVWATRREQSRNTRRTIRITLNGMTMCLKDWCAELGIPYKRAESRIRRGWSVERALTTPVNVKKRW